MDKTKDPGIRIERIIIEGFSFRKVDLLDLSETYSVNINVNNECIKSEDESDGRLLSTIRITEKSGQKFELEVTYGLYASVIKGDENMSLPQFLENNAPPILYQFFRETVLTLTQKAGVPIVIPPMNFRKIKIEHNPIENAGE